MSIFKREEKKKRDISEILTPKSAEEVEGESEEAKEEIVEKEIELEYEEIKEDFGVSALSCFGWKEDKTDKWLIKCAYVWYAIMSFFWFLFGAITFAPIIFISKKVLVIFKDKSKALICGIIVWCVIIASIVLLFATNKSDKSKQKDVEPIVVVQQTETTVN